MIISADSPIRRLPDNLDPKQATFLDGIRYAIDMMDLASGRLTNALTAIALPEAKNQQHSFVAPFSDAWSIIDAIHRLRGLLQQMPGLKKNSPSYQLFVRITKNATELRNVIQHLNKNLPEFAGKGWAVNGAIDWVSITDPSAGLVRSCVIVSGRVQSGEYPLCNPLGMTIRSPVDHVTLHCAKCELNLSDAIRSILPVVRILEACLQSQFPDAKTQGADAFMCMKSELKLESNESENASE